MSGALDEFELSEDELDASAALEEMGAVELAELVLSDELGVLAAEEVGEALDELAGAAELVEADETALDAELELAGTAELVAAELCVSAAELDELEAIIFFLSKTKATFCGG